jgi:hypothetical protein
MDRFKPPYLFQFFAGSNFRQRLRSQFDTLCFANATLAPGKAATPTGDMSESHRDTEPDDPEPARESVPFPVNGAQNVAIPLYGIQDAFKTRAVPVPDNAATQNVQFI